MSQRRTRTLARAACTIGALLTIAAAVPNAAFPFNSQVPAVARIGQRYSFQISDSTFAPASTSYGYSIANQPAWLTIDSATRTLQGTPGASDVGADTFVLIATDGTGAAQMACTLVVSANPAPQLLGDISKQLSATANLSSSDPPVITLLPSATFKFDFGQASFIDVIQRQLFYYATLTDHTPLPSWLAFDAEQLSFSGTAPDLSALPQSWDINLIASDVAGFAGNTASFTIVIAAQQLVFVPEEQELNITAGKAVNITVLRNELFRNDVRLDPGALKSAQAQLPSWLKFDPATLRLEGTAPNDFNAENITVDVTDQLGNTASAVLDLVVGDSSFFNGQIGTLSAQAGQRFSYHFDKSLFNQQGLDTSIDLPGSASWLTYDAESQQLSGTVPLKSPSSSIRVTLVARSPNNGEEQIQSFTIEIEATKSPPSSTSRIPEANNPTSAPTPLAVNDSSKSRLSSGLIAAIAVTSTVVAAALLFALIWCCRRKRQHESYVQGSPRSKTISRPLQPPQGEDIVVSTSVHQDVENGAGIERIDSHALTPTSKIIEPPPQIHVDGIPERRSKWLHRFSRISHASSLGVGEDAVRRDENIPEWGTTPLHTPHDSFSVPTEMARRSTHLRETSPSKRLQGMQNLRAESRPRSSISLKRLSARRGIAGGVAGAATGAGVARHSSRNGRSRRRRTRSSVGALSPTREASSVGSFRTIRTSILSTTPSDFPEPGRPPSKSASALPAGATAVTLDPQRKSIRVVGRSDSVRAAEDDRPDTRPLEKKRESFIKNRHRSGHIQSPLFSHGSRSGSTSLQRHGSQSIEASLAGSVRRSRRMTSGWGSRNALPSQNTLTKYSESSSIEPKGHMDSPHRDSRRFSQKLRTAFVPGYPRAITRSTLFDDNERIDEGDLSSGSWVSSKSDEAPNEFWLEKELAKPRAERDFVLPGESSPITAPPPSLAATAQNSRASTPSTAAGVSSRSHQERIWQSVRERSASPLSQLHNLNSSNSVIRRLAPSNEQKNRMSAPSSHVSADSMLKGRPRIGNASKPVRGVEDVKRLSSMRAEHDAHAAGGSERDGAWLTDVDSEDEVHGAGLIPPLGGSGGRKGDTARSDWTGPVFL